jgi:DNA-binding CsgD family transcriptional regulator
MLDKSTKNGLESNVFKLPAGLHPKDASTEIFQDEQSGDLLAVSQGKSIHFREVNGKIRAQIFQLLLNDTVAMEDLRKYPPMEALERFTKCIFGAANSEPDFDENGNLNATDNRICSRNCMCLKWESKKIILNGKRLTPRLIDVLLELGSDKPDKQIADDLGITESTLNTHKKALFDIAEVQTRQALIKEAYKAKILS